LIEFKIREKLFNCKAVPISGAAFSFLGIIDDGNKLNMDN
jgi:hypothetical protein